EARGLCRAGLGRRLNAPRGPNDVSGPLACGQKAALRSGVPAGSTRAPDHRAHLYAPNFSAMMKSGSVHLKQAELMQRISRVSHDCGQPSKRSSKFECILQILRQITRCLKQNSATFLAVRAA